MTMDIRDRIGRKAPRKVHEIDTCACGLQVYAKISEVDTIMASPCHRNLLEQFWWGPIRKGRATYAESPTAAKWLGIQRHFHSAISSFKQTDHRDRNGLNNMDCNLREASQQQNQWNRARRTGKQFAKGVTLDPRPLRKRFKARIVVETGEIFIGRFETEAEASAAYNLAAQKHFGEFARTDSP